MGPVTAMLNNFMEIVATVPPTLAAGWGVWFVAGGMLAMWYRRARLEAELAPAAPPAPRAPSRAKSSPRQPVAVSREVAPVLSFEEAPAASAYEPPPGVTPVVPREKKPVVIGDPFGDLATLIDQAAAAAAAAAAATPRAPGDSPILSSSGVPLRRGSDEGPSS